MEVIVPLVVEAVAVALLVWKSDHTPFARTDSILHRPVSEAHHMWWWMQEGIDLRTAQKLSMAVETEED